MSSLTSATFAAMNYVNIRKSISENPISTVPKLVWKIVESNLSEYQISYHRLGTRCRPIYQLMPKSGGPPLLLKAYGGDGSFFRVTKEFTARRVDYVVYIWDIFGEPTSYILNVAEAFDVLGPFALKTRAWRKDGIYSWSSATGVPRQRKIRFEEEFCERWDWLQKDIERVR